MCGQCTAGRATGLRTGGGGWCEGGGMATSKRWRMCERKRPYSKREAYKAAVRATERTGKPHRIYKCPYCRAYHITHKPKEDNDDQ
jgi:hypothetical protein